MRLHQLKCYPFLALSGILTFREIIPESYPFLCTADEKWLRTLSLLLTSALCHTWPTPQWMPLAVDLTLECLNSLSPWKTCENVVSQALFFATEPGWIYKSHLKSTFYFKTLYVRSELIKTYKLLVWNKILHIFRYGISVYIAEFGSPAHTPGHQT